MGECSVGRGGNYAPGIRIEKGPRHFISKVLEMSATPFTETGRSTNPRPHARFPHRTPCPWKPHGIANNPAFPTWCIFPIESPLTDCYNEIMSSDEKETRMTGIPTTGMTVLRTASGVDWNVTLMMKDDPREDHPYLVVVRGPEDSEMPNRRPETTRVDYDMHFMAVEHWDAAVADQVRRRQRELGVGEREVIELTVTGHEVIA